ncbi:MAG: type IV pilus assembly protein PilM [Planctomycetes bacterium]|nr:type IV pilus assembly protein PilM [Planctomycetota bacterium]
MAASVHGVWGIDVGVNSLKAVRLIEGEDGLEVIGFDYIEHRKLLSGGNVSPEEKHEIIAETVSTFVSRNEIEKDEVAISVAGHNAFARFVSLPPVDAKKIPEIVKYEAVQQIPFNINEVEWDWQLMETPDSPVKEVGLFAIKNELVNEIVDVFAHENMRVTCVQIAPIALHNYVNYDRDDIASSSRKATILLDMGADNTTLVVSTKTSVWQRSIRIGGNAFTEAISDAFHLKFAKAEKLKRTATVSKYIRQIFSAMKPVYTDLGSEVQRSLGFYTSSGSGRQKGFSKMIVFGGGMKLKGVAKYLQQTLGIPVIVPDSFEKLKIAEDVSSARFHENITDYGVAYGLAVQLLGEAKITSNLLPKRIASAMAWARKEKLFTIAASILLAVSVLSLVVARVNAGKYNSKAAQTYRSKTKQIISIAQGVQNRQDEQLTRDDESAARMEKQMAYFDYRDVIPVLAQRILASLPNKDNNKEQVELYEAFAAGDTNAVKKIDRQQRKQIFVTGLSINYTQSIKTAPFRIIKSGVRGRGGRRARDDTNTRSRDDDEDEYSGAYGSAKYYNVPGSQTAAGVLEDGEIDNGPGFVVTIEGFSPYAEIIELLDPSGVGTDQSKWGFVTRLQNLDQIFKNCQFELFKREEIEHFIQKTGEVDLNATEIPGGIGTVKEFIRVVIDTPDNPVASGRRPMYNMRGMHTLDRIQIEMGLIDPLTKEEIAKTLDFRTQEEIDNDPSIDQDDLGRIKTDRNGDQMYITRDHWFRINAKFLWKNAPKQETAAKPLSPF